MNDKAPRRHPMAVAGKGTTVALLLACGLLAAWRPAAARVAMPGEELTPSGLRRNTSLYVTLHDGVPLAVDVWLPPNHRQGDRWPVLMRTTRYWRAPEIGWLTRLLVILHVSHVADFVDRQRDAFNRRGFVVLKVDARGSGASGGRRVAEYSPAEIADIGEVAAWAAAQPWSNGRVGTYGVSYEGNTAELAAVSNPPALRAVMPLYDDFDSLSLVEPGGVLLRQFVVTWSRGVAALDRNDVCAAQEVAGFACWRLRQAAPGVKPVDSDRDRGHRQLAALVAQRVNASVADAMTQVEYRDDTLSPAGIPLAVADLSPYAHRREIEASGVAMMVWCGWLDADACAGTLSRYRTLSNPQVVIIGALSHGGSFNVDPFASQHLPPVPSRDEQYRMEGDFFAGTVGNAGGAGPPSPSSSIRYYTMGEGAWHSTTVWPPAGLQTERLFLAAERTLSAHPPVGESAAAGESAATEADTYAVDFTASSGTQTRWHTQLGGGDVVYPDRTAEDRKLLVYTGEPLAADLEITGSPVLTLTLASTASDGAVHAYLEDVGPDGRTTYLDEGVFRLIHRREVDPASLPYEPLGPAHSFRRRDAAPLPPGEAVTVRFALYPTSLLVRRGHRLRLALAGADAPLFQRYPATGEATWTVYRELGRASFLELPVRQR